MAKPTRGTIRIGPNKLTAKPLSPAPRGMMAPKPPGQSNNPAAVKKASRGGRK
jgi:hypothetical protein